MRGGYAGHGETNSHPQDLIWWAKGELHGEASERIGLRDVLEESVHDPTNARLSVPWDRVSSACDGETTMIYFGDISRQFGLPVCRRKAANTRSI